MKFSINKNTLQSTLAEHNKVIPIRTTLPILACAVFSVEKTKLTITTSDLEQTIISKTKIASKEEGSIALPISKLLEIISALTDEDIKITSNKDNQIEISSIQGVYKITGKEIEDFPETPEIKTKEEVVLGGEEFLDIIKKTGYAASKDDLKPALCGVYFNIEKNNLTAVATDGHKLVKHTKKTQKTRSNATSLVLPVKFLSIVNNLTDNKTEIKLTVGENHVSTEQKNFIVLSRIIKEEFPDFNSVIPEDNTIKAKVKTQNLISCLKRVSIFSNRTTKQTVLTFSAKGLTVSAQDIETSTSAKEHLDCDFSGEELTTSYNAKYLIEVLQHLDEKEITIYLKTPLTAAVFAPPNKETTALLMPIRLNQ